MRLATGIPLVLLSLPLVLSAAEVKRWVDGEGGIHFGDRPPQGAPFVIQEVDPVSVAPGPRGLKLRPGEIETLQRYERRVEKRSTAGRGGTQGPNPRGKTGERAAFYRKRCEYYRQRQAFFRDKKRHGYTRAEEPKIDERIAWSAMKVADYCR